MEFRPDGGPQDRCTTIARLLNLLAPLRDAGAVAVCADYCGGGDEGSIETIYALDAAGELVDCCIAPEAHDLLQEFEPEGYQDHEGGYGVIRLELPARRVVVEHFEYTLQVTPHTREYGAEEAP